MVNKLLILCFLCSLSVFGARFGLVSLFSLFPVGVSSPLGGDGAGGFTVHQSHRRRYDAVFLATLACDCVALSRHMVEKLVILCFLCPLSVFGACVGMVSLLSLFPVGFLAPGHLRPLWLVFRSHLLWLAFSNPDSGPLSGLHLQTCVARAGPVMLMILTSSSHDNACASFHVSYERKCPAWVSGLPSWFEISSLATLTQEPGQPVPIINC